MTLTQEYTEAASEHALVNAEVRREFGRSYSQLHDADYKRNPALMRKWEKTYCRYVAAVKAVRKSAELTQGGRA